MTRKSLRKHYARIMKVFELTPEREIYQSSKMIIDLLNKTEWIPVTERLPEEKINPITVDYFEYQCTVRFGNLYDVRSYKYGKGHWRLGATIVDDYVIAWRELPEPYKAESEA